MKLKPLEPPYDPEIESVLNRYPKASGQLLSLFRVFANSSRFLGGKGVVDLLDRASPLTLREREIVILRTTANWRCEYEWGVHVTGFARAANFLAEEIDATLTPEALAFEGREATLVSVVDQLCASGSLEPDIRHAFDLIWNAEEQLEILALIGNYSTVSFVSNVAGLDPEPFAARFLSGG